MHPRLRNVLHWCCPDAVLPQKDLFVVRRRHHSAVVVDESTRIDCTQMLHVLLHRFIGRRARVPLYQILVRASRENAIIPGVNIDAVGNPLAGPRLNALPRLGVPVPHHLVVPSARKMPPILRKAYIPHGLRVTHIGAHALAVVVDIPDLDLAVHRARQQQVPRLREPTDRMYPLSVSGPRVHARLGDVALVVVWLKVRGDIDPSAALVVSLLLAVKLARRFDDTRHIPLLQLLLDCRLLLLLALHLCHVLGHLLRLLRRELRPPPLQSLLQRKIITPLALLCVPLRRLVHRPPSHVGMLLEVADYTPSVVGTKGC
mmetsp:Transcript_34639/g.67880  ORF Transcript_34639/g.67880 Transcript_34639/m.67880 type:complete len:316 (+) Transcript_34639:631-1578(+)